MGVAGHHSVSVIVYNTHSSLWGVLAPTRAVPHAGHNVLLATLSFQAVCASLVMGVAMGVEPWLPKATSKTGRCDVLFARHGIVDFASGEKVNFRTGCSQESLRARNDERCRNWRKSTWRCPQKHHGPCLSLATLHLHTGRALKCSSTKALSI
jgi:hypothetical protein